MKNADCPKCGTPAFQQKLTFAPERTTSSGIAMTITRSPVVTIRCGGDCKGTVRGSTIRDTSKAWNERAKRILAEAPEASDV